MAGFKAHISFGVLTAVVYAGFLFSVLKVPMQILQLSFCITVFSSMLPDIDSNSGIPVQIIFSILSISATVWMFDFAQYFTQSAFEGALMSIGLGLFFYTVVQHAFKRLTSHRGAFHSVPMAIIMGLGFMLLLAPYKLGAKTTLALSFSVVAGYLCHLLLDELNSAVNLSGETFRPKKSLGTAMKFTASTSSATAALYTALGSLLFLSQGLVQAIVNGL